MVDEGPREVHVRIEDPGSRRAVRIAWIGAALIFVAMAKPWPQPAPPEHIANQIARATPQVSAEPGLAVIEPCAGSWWSVEVDEAAESVARVWVLTDAVEATGPLDARIRFVTVAAQQVRGLGFCPPFHDVPTRGSVTFFRLDPAPTPFRTTPVQMPQLREVAANTLYRPASTDGQGASGPGPPWAAGRYVMRIDGSDGYERWLGLDLRLVTFPARPLPSAGPAV
ncbi:MAG TPA: hypothetical protein VIF63_01430 [Candidatus Limnocylindrales bacterium]|jgi:hypothetical protein